MRTAGMLGAPATTACSLPARRATQLPRGPVEDPRRDVAGVKERGVWRVVAEAGMGTDGRCRHTG